jgi:hypothetical protein
MPPLRPGDNDGGEAPLVWDRAALEAEGLDEAAVRAVLRGESVVSDAVARERLELWRRERGGAQ